VKQKAVRPCRGGRPLVFVNFRRRPATQHTLCCAGLAAGGSIRLYRALLRALSRMELVLAEEFSAFPLSFASSASKSWRRTFLIRLVRPHSSRAFLSSAGALCCAWHIRMVCVLLVCFLSTRGHDTGACPGNQPQSFRVVPAWTFRPGPGRMSGMARRFLLSFLGLLLLPLCWSLSLSLVHLVGAVEPHSDWVLPPPRWRLWRFLLWESSSSPHEARPGIMCSARADTRPVGHPDGGESAQIKVSRQAAASRYPAATSHNLGPVFLPVLSRSGPAGVLRSFDLH